MIPCLVHGEPHYICLKLLYSQVQDNRKHPQISDLLPYSDSSAPISLALPCFTTEAQHKAQAMLPSFDFAEPDVCKCGPACCRLSTLESSFSGSDLCHHSISSVNQHLMGTFRRVRLATVARRGHSWVPCNKIHSVLSHSLFVFSFFSFYIYALAYSLEILIVLAKFN